MVSRTLIRLRFRLRGVVQGVGIRPFLYRLATEERLSGFVYNDGQGVVLEVQGDTEQITRFRGRLKRELPPAARLDSLRTHRLKLSSDEGFRILASPPGGLKFTRLSPDLATCADCLHELNDPADRRFHYPFTNCTNCGPRLTIIQDVPYDRPRTTMARFNMCPDCQREYDDPTNRRFHAQPNACPVCGPHLLLQEAGLSQPREDAPPPQETGLFQPRASRIETIRPPIYKEQAMIQPPENLLSGRTDEAIRLAAQALQRGQIVAVKGVGGMHLACDASNPQAVARLRSRKVREEKPFALMVRDLQRARELAYINSREEVLLTSVARPIVILDRKSDSPIASEISPGLNTIGLMLPYTPLHSLLLEACRLDLVMTSGNLSDEPIAFQDDEIVPRLKGIADFFLLHNRPIHLRCDDSVVRVVHNQTMILRRSRGYVPDPIRLPHPLKRPVLACGAELKSTFCLGQDDYLILSHHLGDLEDQTVFEAYEEGVEHFQKLFYIQPEALSCDLHPDYLSSQYAQKRGLPLLQVQHHHAHALAALAETGDFSPAMAWTLDGVGLGTDGTLWGGECLRVEGWEYQRLAQFRPLPLPGGEKAIREPWRIAMAALLAASPRNGGNLSVKLFPQQPVATVLQMLERHINCPLSSGTGRLFDAVAALAGVREEIAYEAQAAILLEAMTVRERPTILDSVKGIPPYAFHIEWAGARVVIDWRDTILEILQDRLSGASPGEIGARFHAGLVKSLLSATLKLRERTGLNRIVLTGGVFQNRILLSNLWRELEEAGFEVIVPSQVPINDGGIALGQAAALWLKQLKK